MWFLARMSRDCSNRVVIAQGGTPHVHVQIAPQSGPGIKSKDVAPFARELCEHYATMVFDWVKAPAKERCVHCAQLLPGRNVTEKGCSSLEGLRDKFLNSLPVPIRSLPPAWTWQGGRYGNNEKIYRLDEVTYDDVGCCMSARVTEMRLFRREDRKSDCFRATTEGGPLLKKIKRRVTIDKNS